MAMASHLRLQRLVLTGVVIVAATAAAGTVAATNAAHRERHPAAKPSDESNNRDRRPSSTTEGGRPLATTAACPDGQWRAEYFGNVTLSGPPAAVQCET